MDIQCQISTTLLKLIGARAKKDIRKGTKIKPELFEDSKVVKEKGKLQKKLENEIEDNIWL